MYCQKCGKELQEGEQFCSGCGTKAGSPGTASLSLDVEKLHSRLTERLDRLGAHKTTYLVGILLLIVNLFLMNKEMIEITYTVWGTNSIQVSMFDGKDWLRYVFYAAYLVGIVLMVMPLIAKENGGWQKKNFQLGMVTPLVNAVWLVIASIAAKSIVEDRVGSEFMEYVEIEIGLAGTAWLFLAVSVIAGVAIYKTKKALAD